MNFQMTNLKGERVTLVNLCNVIERNIVSCLLLAMVAALILPAMGPMISPLVKPLFIVILLLTFLKVHFLEVLQYLKKPGFLAYIIVMYLLCIPTIIFFIFSNIDSTLGIGFLLLAAMPPAIAAPAFTDIVKGNTALCLPLVVIGSIISPFSVSLLFLLFAKSVIEFRYQAMFGSLVLIIFLPMILSETIKKILPSYVKKIENYLSAFNVVIISIITYTIMANQSEEIFKRLESLARSTIWLFVFFLLLYVMGYLVAIWRSKEDKIATSIGKAFMNNGLAVVIAYQFFSPDIILLAVLSEFPQIIMAGLFKSAQRYLP